jgi:hypothetical protein
MNNAIQHVSLYSAEVCVDTDNGATDKNGDGCNFYRSDPGNDGYCGDYDDEDFFSSEMCCACGGGFFGNIPYILCHISQHSCYLATEDSTL